MIDPITGEEIEEQPLVLPAPVPVDELSTQSQPRIYGPGASRSFRESGLSQEDFLQKDLDREGPRERIGPDVRERVEDARSALLSDIDRQTRRLSGVGDRADAQRKSDLLRYIDLQGDAMSNEQKLNLLEAAGSTNRIDRLSTVSSAGRQLAAGLGMPARTAEKENYYGERVGGNRYNVMQGFESQQNMPLTEWLEQKKLGNEALDAERAGRKRDEEYDNARTDAARALADQRRRAGNPGEEPAEEPAADPYVAWAQQAGIEYAPGDKVAQSVIDERRKQDLRVKAGLVKIDAPEADTNQTLIEDQATVATARKELSEALKGMEDPKNKKPGWDWRFNKSTWEGKITESLKKIEKAGGKVTLRDPKTGKTQEVDPSLVLIGIQKYNLEYVK